MKIRLTFLCWFGFICLCRLPAQQTNIVLIMADDLGYSDLGCYGGEIATPNLDRLAADGLRFTQFYNTGRCWPTRGALLTGYYAQQIRRDKLPGVQPSGAGGTRPAWARLLPDMLRKAGYRSYHSGKWHIDGMPLENGFDRSYYLRDQGRFFNPKVHYEDDEQLPAVEPGTGFYGTTAIADHAVKYLQEHAAEYPDRPFFHYIAFTAPHFPLHAEQEDIDRYREIYRRDWEKMRKKRYRRQKKMGIVDAALSKVEREVGPPYHFPEALDILGDGEVNRPLPWRELTKEQREFQAVKMAIHAAMIDRMDREIGRVIEQLRSMGVLDNTLILFLSDNGASAEIMVRDDGHDPAAPPGSAATYLCLGPGWSTTANTPFRRHKTWVHEGGVATPFIVHWPEGIRSEGALRHNPGHVVDVVPTLLEVAGVEPFSTWSGEPVPPSPGRSLLPAFAEDQSVRHEYLWWYHEDNRAVRVGDWKLAAAGAEAPWELYDLSRDRTEMNNLAGQMPEKVRELERIWKEKMEAFREQALGGMAEKE
jgi:arylsulfatase